MTEPTIEKEPKGSFRVATAVVPAGDASLPSAVPADKLKVGTKLGYGAGDIGAALSYSAISVFFLFYLVEIVGLSPSLGGIIVMSARLIDAVTDPIMGVITDRTRSKFGRRKPYILFGAIPFGLTFALLWMLPEGAEGTVFAIACALIIAHTLVFTVTVIPYHALTPEIATDYHERTSLTGYRTFFAVFATLIAFAAPPALSAAFNEAAGLPHDARHGWTMMGIILGVMMSAAWFTVVASVRERPTAPIDTEPVQILKEYRSAFRAYGYLPTLALFLVVTTAVGLVSAILPFYLASSARLGPDDQSMMLGLTFGLSALSLPLWTWLGARLGKKKAFIIGLVVYVTGLSSLALVQVNGEIIPLLVIASSIGGLGTGAVMLFPWAMLPDVLEFDELETGKRREGVFYSLFAFVQKLAYALGVFLCAQALSVFGYVRGAEPQSDQALFGIHLMLGGVTTVILLVSMWLVSRYPITEEAHNAVRVELAKRQTPRS